VKTDGETGEDSKLASHLHLNTITHEHNMKALQRVANFCNPQRIISRERLDHFQKAEGREDGRRREGTGEKEKTAEKEKEQKGKYRCRVNQYIFDHSRKKSNHCSK
jgi:hypothetical protein